MTQPIFGAFSGVAGFTFGAGGGTDLDLDLNFATATYTDGGNPILLTDYFEDNEDHFGGWDPGTQNVANVGWQITSTGGSGAFSGMDFKADKMTTLFGMAGVTFVFKTTITCDETAGVNAAVAVFADNLPDFDFFWFGRLRFNGYVSEDVGQGIGHVQEQEVASHNDGIDIISSVVSGPGPYTLNVAMSFDAASMRISVNGGAVATQAFTIDWVVSNLCLGLTANDTDNGGVTINVTRAKVMPIVADADLPGLST